MAALTGIMLHEASDGLTIYRPTPEGVETGLGDDPFEWTVGGGALQWEIPALREVPDVDAWARSASDPLSGDDELAAFIRANETALMPADPPEKWIRVPWRRFVERRLRAAARVWESMDALDRAYATGPLNARLRVLSACGKFHLDGTSVRIRWSGRDTKTGRLRTEGESNPINMKRAERAVRCGGSAPDRLLVQGDFRALEFRIALRRLGRPDLAAVDDPYTAVMHEASLRRSDRTTVKQVCIALLYGMDPRRAHMDEADAVKLALWFEDNIDLRGLLGRLGDEVRERGFFRNPFGRRVLEEPEAPDRMLVNNYFQSTGSDTVLVRCADLLDVLTGDGVNANIVFLVHDSMVFDVHEDAVVDLVSHVELDGFPLEWGPFC